VGIGNIRIILNGTFKRYFLEEEQLDWSFSISKGCSNVSSLTVLENKIELNKTAFTTAFLCDFFIDAKENIRRV